MLHISSYIVHYISYIIISVNIFKSVNIFHLAQRPLALRGYERLICVETAKYGELRLRVRRTRCRAGRLIPSRSRISPIGY